MGEEFVDMSARRDTLPSTEARVRLARDFYQHAVAAYLAAGTERERGVAGEAMYFAQLATIEARFNPEGSARFRALAEARMTGPTATSELRVAA